MTGFTLSGRRVRARKTNGTAKTQRIAKKALKIANKNIDMRNNLLSRDGFTLPVGAVITVDYLEPDGNRERLTYSQIEGKVWIRQAQASIEHDSWRCDLVLDRQPNGVVLDLVKVYGDATPKITALLTFNERDRYKIVRSWQGSFSDDSGTGARSFHFIQKTGLVAESSANTFTQALITKNAYYFVFWTESAVATPIISYDINTTVVN